MSSRSTLLSSASAPGTRFAVAALIACLGFFAQNAVAAIPRVSSVGAAQGQTFTLRVSLTQTAPHQPLSIESIDARLTFDSTRLTVSGVRVGSGLAAGTHPPILHSNVSPGTVVAGIAVLDGAPLSEGIQLLEVDFTVSATAPVGMTKVLMPILSVNGGALMFANQNVPPMDGFVTVSASAPDTGDAPLPVWSLVALAAALWMIGQRRIARRRGGTVRA